MTYHYDDKVILVTGGAGGIGSAFARYVAERGARVVLVDIDAARSEAVAASLPRPGLGLAGDLTDDAFVAELVEVVRSTYGRLDVLVNNVGITSTEAFSDRSVADIRREIEVNLISPIVLSRLALDVLKCSDDPRLVTTVSLGGVFPDGETPVYTASKFGLRGAMLSLGLGLAEQGVKVSAIMPAAVDTRMLHREAIEGGNVAQFQSVPIPPSEVVEAIISVLDRPRLETSPQPWETRFARLAMVAPNLLPRLIPLFEKRGVRGRDAYLRGLEKRGIARRDGAGWDWSDEHRP